MLRPSLILTTLLFLFVSPLLCGAVTVTTKAQFLAELPLTPGKTITITDQTITGAGDWGPVTITGDCTQAQPCVIKAQTPLGVVFQGQDAGNFCLNGAWYTFTGFRWTGQTGFGSYSTNGGCTDAALISFDGAQNVTVDGIRIDNISGGGTPINWMEFNGGRSTLNNTWSNSTVSNWTQNASAAIYIYARDDRGFPSGIAITDVLLEDRTVTDPTSLNKYWLRVGNGQNSLGHPTNVVITRLTVRRDTTSGNAHDTFHMKTDNLILQDSVFDQTARIKNRQGSGWIIRRNKFINPVETDHLHMYNFGHTIANNLFYTNTARQRGLTLGKGHGLTTGNDYVAFNDSIVINNTFDGYTVAAIDATRNSVGNNQGTTTVFPQDITFHNNVVRQQSSTMFLGPAGCAIFTAVGYNARNGGAAAGCMASGSNNVDANPQWTNPAGGDYSLQGGSPLVNAGTAVGGTTEDNVDILNTTRVAPIDIGAYEFGGVVEPPPSGNTWYVDPSCTVSGDGSGETCDTATGPYVSLEEALESCAGMQAGDILFLKSPNTAKPSNGSQYDSNAHHDKSVNIDVADACSGIIVQNASNSWPTLDGTRDINAAGCVWTSIGGGVYEGQTGSCGAGTAPAHPFRAWYDLGGGELTLDFIHSTQTCTTGLAEGKMSYNPITFDSCVHLAGGADPNGAVYFRIPDTSGTLLRFETNSADNITFRRNPDGTGGVVFSRFRDDMITYDPSKNTDHKFSIITFEDAGSSFIRAVGTPGDGNIVITNNTFTRACEGGILLHGDTGVVTLSGNTLSEIGPAPLCEQCNGVGDGCLPNYNEDPAAISLNNQTAIDDTDNIRTENNIIFNGGGGYRGIGHGIRSLDATHANIINANNIYDGTAANGYNAISFINCPVSPCHDHIRVTNNRLEDVDVGFYIDFDTAVAQTNCRSFIYGNTVFNASTHALFQDSGPNAGCEFWVKDNLFVSADGDGVALVNIPASTNLLESAFTSNGFECSHANCSAATIATLQGVNHQREGDCTPATNCVEDYGTNNRYLSPSNVQATTLQVTSGGEGIDAGEELSFLPTDYVTTVRPFGCCSDMGAFEFAGGAPTTNLTQRSFRMSGALAINDSAEALAPEGVDLASYINGRWNMTISVTGDSGIQMHSRDFVLRYEYCNPTCGGYVVITTDCASNPTCLLDNPARANGAAIASALLALDGRTFSTQSVYLDGEPEEGGEAVEVAMTANKQWEGTWAVRVGDTAATGGILRYRVYDVSGSPLNVYLAEPEVEIGSGRFIRSGGRRQ